MSNLQTQLKSDFQWIRPLHRDLQSIKSLKKSFISALILAQFNLKKETRLEADSSGYTAGGALL